MNFEVKQQILNKIKEYDRIMIFRHVRNDGDCVGATKGLKRIIQLTWPEKEVYLIDQDTAKYLEFMGPEDEEVADEIYESALGIVVDTASEAGLFGTVSGGSVSDLKIYLEIETGMKFARPANLFSFKITDLFPKKDNYKGPRLK